MLEFSLTSQGIVGMIMIVIKITMINDKQKLEKYSILSQVRYSHKEIADCKQCLIAVYSTVLLSLLQLLDELITTQSIRESQPCLSSLLRCQQWYGNVHCCDRNLLFTNPYNSAESDIKGNVYLLSFLLVKCISLQYPSNGTKYLPSAKGQEGLS